MSHSSLEEILFSNPRRSAVATTSSSRVVTPQERSAAPQWGELRLVDPSDRRFSTKERNALNDALRSAWNSNDPVRWILVRARAEFLGFTARRYAPEIGLAPHSLVTKEQKGGENVSPSSYSHFFQDWERRSAEDSQRGRDFSRASKLLMHQLLGKDYFGLAGLVTRWQCRVGAQEFARRTDLDPKLLSGYRAHGFNPHFGQLIDIARRAQLIVSNEAESVWNHPVVVEARREFLRVSQRCGRSPSTTLLRCAIELHGDRPTEENIKRGYSLLTEQERRMLLRYDRLPVHLFERLVDIVVKRGLLPAEERDRLLGICKSENRRSSRGADLQSIKILQSRMKVIGLTNSSLLALFEGSEGTDRREAMEHLRRGVQRIDESSRVFPFGVVAWVVAQNSSELKKILISRRDEVQRSYRKRFGTAISEESVERKIWGLTEAELSSAGGDARKAAMKKVLKLGIPAKQRLLQRVFLTPQAFVTHALAMFPHNTLGSQARSSAEMLARIASGEVHPHRELYKRIVEASRIPFQASLDLLWYDSHASHHPRAETKTEFGAMQCAIIDALVAARAEHQQALLLKYATPPEAQRAARELLKLERSADIPLVLFQELLGYMGIVKGTPESSTIAHLMRAKKYPEGIVSWYREGMVDAEQNLRDAAACILEGARWPIKDMVIALPADPLEVMELSEKVAQGAASRASTPQQRIIEAARALLHVFPGASIADLEVARDRIAKASSLEPAIQFAWSRSGRAPTKSGSLHIEPTTSTGTPISLQTAAQIPSAIHCPRELSTMLASDSFRILSQMDHSDVSDPWSGAILRSERGVSADDVKHIAEVLLPKLLPALSLKPGIADNLLRWQRALWNKGKTAREVVELLRARRAELLKSSETSVVISETPMGIIDAAIVAASAFRKKVRR
jgi:hypothetical protein